MENENNCVRTTAFVSSGYNENRRASRGFYERMGLSKRKAGSSASGGKLLFRLFVCAAAFVGILGLKLAGGAESIAVMNGITGEENSESRTDEELGKLKFVELPSIIEVFAPSNSAVLPVSVLSFELSSEGVTLITTIGADVVSPMDGKVLDIGEDAVFGRFVTIGADGDYEFTLFGLKDIAVEKGQPVKKRQKLGATLGASLSVKAYKSGRPVDVSEIFDFGSSK